MTPKLLEAAKLIGYDNGCINRQEPEEKWVAECEARLSTYCTLMQLNETELWLAGLTAAQMEDVCCGEQHTNIPAYADYVLDCLFEEPT